MAVSGQLASSGLALPDVSCWLRSRFSSDRRGLLGKRVRPTDAKASLLPEDPVSPGIRVFAVVSNVVEIALDHGTSQLL